MIGFQPRRWCLLVLALHVGLAIGQDAEITGAELVSGLAAATLSEMAQLANQQEGPLRVVAPERWHNMIRKQLTGQLDAGKLRFENSDGQTIRFFLTPDGANATASGTKPLAPEAPVAAAPSASDASQALKDSARSQVQNLQPQIMGADELLGRTRTLKPDLGQAPGASEPSPATKSTNTEAAMVKTEPVEKPAAVAATIEPTSPAVETPQADPEEVQTAQQPESEPEVALVAPAEALVESTSSGAADDEAAARRSLQERINRGREIGRSIGVADLRRADVLFVTRGVMAVVRSSGTRKRVYWLDGELDLERPEIKRERAGRYSVRRPLSGNGGRANWGAKAVASEDASRQSVAAEEIAAKVVETPAEVMEQPANETSAAAVVEVRQPPADLAEKLRMEKVFNSGRSIDRELSVAALRPDDVLYVGNNRVLVARRVQAKMKRYWLSESIDLSLNELEKTGNRRYRVSRRIR